MHQCLGLQTTTVLQLVATRGPSLLYMHSLQGRPLQTLASMWHHHGAGSMARVPFGKASLLTQSHAFSMGWRLQQLDSGILLPTQHLVRLACYLGACVGIAPAPSREGDMLYLAMIHRGTPEKELLVFCCVHSVPGPCFQALPCLLGSAPRASLLVPSPFGSLNPSPYLSLPSLEYL